MSPDCILHDDQSGSNAGDKQFLRTRQSRCHISAESTVLNQEPEIYARRLADQPRRAADVPWFGFFDYRGWPRCRLHSPRAERMREKIPITPSA